MAAGSGRRQSGEACGFVGVTASLDLETVSLMHGQAASAGPSEAPGWPHKGSALAGRRGKVSSDPIAWREAPAHGVGSAVQGNGNEGGAPIAVLRCQAFN